MVFQKLSFIFILVIFITVVCGESPDLIIELFRHGARAPEYSTYDTENYWVNRLGQLTPVGMRMHYVLGKSMRERYPELLSKYDPKKVYVRSTDLDRTLMSAYSHMQGVFEHTGPEIEMNSYFNNHDSSDQSDDNRDGEGGSLEEFFGRSRSALPNKAQVVPIYSLPLEEDHLLRSYHRCESTGKYRQQNMEDQATMDVYKNDMKEVATYLISKGIEVSSFFDLRKMGEFAISHKFENIKLPAGIKPDSQFYKDLKFAYEYYFTKAYEGIAIQRSLYAVPILEAIIGYIEDFLKGETPRNAIFLSAHDTTLMTLLAAFNITNPDCLVDNYRNEKKGKPIQHPDCIYPQYASNVIFEIYKSPEPSIAFFYDGKPIDLCGTQGERCRVKDFILKYVKKVTQGLTTQEYYNACDSQHPRNQTSEVNVGQRKVILQSMGGYTRLEIILMFASVVLSLLIVVHWILKKREENENHLEKGKSTELQGISGSPNRSADRSQASQEC